MGEIVPRLKSNYREQDKHYSTTFALLLYNFCALLIILLQAETVLIGTECPDAASLATSIVQLVDDRWIEPDISSLVGGLPTSILVTMLSIAGFVLNPVKCEEGRPFPSLFGYIC